MQFCSLPQQQAGVIRVSWQEFNCSDRKGEAEIGNGLPREEVGSPPLEELGHRLDSMISEDFSNLCNPRIV